MKVKQIFSSEDFSDPNYFSLLVSSMKFVAQWPIDVSEYLPRSLKFLSKILCKFLQLLSIAIPAHICVLQTITCYDLIGKDLDALADCCTVLLVYVFGLFSVTYIQMKHSLLRDTVELMNNKFRKRSAKGLTFTKVNNSCMLARRFTIGWTLLCILGTTLWTLYPLTIPGRNLPLKCWYPFDTDQPYVFELLYISQFISQTHLGIAFPNSSSLYVSEIIMACGQYDLLFCSLKNITYTAQLEYAGVTPKIRQAQRTHDFIREEVNQYYCSVEEYDDLEPIRLKQSQFKGSDDPELTKKKAFQAAIKECVSHHLVILDFCKKIESFFSPVCFVKSLQIMFQLCFMAFFVVNAEYNFFRMINFGQYLMLTTMELTLYTYFAETLFRHSHRVGDAIVRSKWYTESKVVGKDISIMLSQALKPVQLTSGKFSAMDMEKWKMILSSAFSYFTLLQNLK